MEKNMGLSRDAEKVIGIVAVAVGFIACLAVGAALMMGINSERASEKSDVKYEFFDAIKANDLQKVKEMLKETPELVNIPLSETEKEYSKNLNDDTPLIAAGVNMPMIRLLVENGADVNAQTPISGRYPVTAVLARAEIDRFDVAWFYIGKGAALDCEDKINGNLPYAAISQYVYGHSSGVQEDAREMLEFLTKKGVRMYMPASMKSDMSSLLGVAAKNNHCCAIIHLLSLSNEFNINEKVTYDGKTALMVAAKNGCYQAVYELQRRGAHEGLKDDAGHTAYDYARMSGNDYVIGLLE